MATEWVSRISGPIASHDGINVVGPSSHRGYQNGTPQFEVQGRGYESNRGYKNANKDFMRDNVRRMREIQKASKLRDEEKSKPVKSTWRSTRYEDVPSKVAEHIYREPPPPRRPASAGHFRSPQPVRHQDQRPSRRDDVPGLVIESQRDSISQAPERWSVGSTLRTGSARQVRGERGDEHRKVDFIRANMEAARLARFRRSPSADQLDDLKRRKEREQASYQRGRMPDYLIQQREDEIRAEREWRARQPDVDQPPGHRRMPENERMEALTLLKTSEKELLMDLCKLPIRTDTLRVRRMKEDIEAKLSEIEEAIKIFSKPKVFVKIE